MESVGLLKPGMAYGIENPSADEIRRYEKCQRLKQIIELNASDYKTVAKDKAARAKFIEDYRIKGGVIKAEKVITRPATPKKKGSDVK